MNDHFSSDTKYKEYALSAMTKCKNMFYVSIYLAMNAARCSAACSTLISLT